jgi:hypothetical protein
MWVMLLAVSLSSDLVVKYARSDIQMLFCRQTADLSSQSKEYQCHLKSYFVTVALTPDSDKCISYQSLNICGYILPTLPQRPFTDRLHLSRGDYVISEPILARPRTPNWEMGDQEARSEKGTNTKS